MTFSRPCRVPNLHLGEVVYFAAITLFTALSLLAFSGGGPAQAATQPTNGIRASGTQLVNGSGAPLRLVGINRSGSEYTCIDGSGIFQGPTDQNAIAVIKSWHVNMVRLPLNEQCWLGRSSQPNTTGAPYRAAISDFVNRLNANGIYVVLDLHFTYPYNGEASDPQRSPMANRQFSVPFWQSVANTYKTNPSVMFELFNEPHDIPDWSCWRNGCYLGYQTAGMQEMVTAVRNQGATNPIILNGLDWGHDMRGLLANLPTDPAGQLVAGQHLYDFKRCSYSSCWDQEFGPVAAAMPLLAPEIGVDQCGGTFVENFMNWMDGNGGDGYGFWVWAPGPCPASSPFGGSSLLTDWNGTATPYGAAVKAHFARVNPDDTGTVTPPGTTTTTSPPTTTSTSTTTTASPTTTTTTTTTLPPTTTTTTTTTSTTTPLPTTTATTSAPTSTTTTTRPGGVGGSSTQDGYRLVTTAGRVHGFGEQPSLGDAPPGVDIAAVVNTPDGQGYWLAATDGRVFNRGTAALFGDMGGKPLNGPIVGMASTPNGGGYYLLGSDGGVFSFGNAKFWGSTGNLRLNAPVVAMAVAADGNGYWFTARDGGVFSYGPSAPFRGSMGGQPLNKPVVGLAATSNGYWLVASDGGVFSFNMPFHGSAGNIRLNAPVVGISATRNGGGYFLVASDGGVFTYGNSPFYGSAVGSATSPVRSITG